ncbi:hypothetical protein [Planococcus faecalis]|uniref:Uncharacterized protein n=1 Tax=Planococcus faecalis TaxID=1598147 RepID=A0ABN4XR89_9BACL|nr:hypothetical protein [Planococcus faecalis]AQU80215.1 hypothetical protein AJGP001_13435 [Planococcus faecalis]OHX51982.1 hypothetical protein BB777_03680 [Planococcus faecalis]
MILSVILGLTVDTPIWIKYLSENGADHIVVLNYDHMGEPEKNNEVLYLSPFDVKIEMNKFDSVEFYKSLYGYPGMGGNMSSLYKSKKDDVED